MTKNENVTDDSSLANKQALRFAKYCECTNQVASDADAWQKKRKAAADARRRQKQKTEQAGAAGRRESAEMIEARSIQKATNNTIMLDCCKTAKETGCFDADMADLLKKNTMAALQASLCDKDNDDDDEL